MTDTYVDVAEITGYSTRLVAALEQYQDLDPIVSTIISRHKGVLEQWNTVYQGAMSGRSGLRMSQGDRRELSDRVQARLSDLLEELRLARKKVTFDMAAFFPTDRKKDIGLSFNDRRLALERVIAGFKQYPEIPGSESTLSELEALYSEFAGNLEATEKQSSIKLLDSDELKTAKGAWSKDYQAAKYIMRGLLLLADRENEMTVLFRDLVGSSASKSSSEPSQEAAEEGTG